MKFTEKELKELILTLMLGQWVRETVDEYEGKEYEYPGKYEKQIKYFLELAEKLGYRRLFKKFKGELITSNSLGKEEEKIVEIFHDDVFWEELTTRMGKRDFYRTMTEEEKKEARKKHWLPERVDKFYEKYRSEFERFGIDRLQIIKKK